MCSAGRGNPAFSCYLSRVKPTALSSAQQLYAALMSALAAALLVLFLICEIEGVITLFLYEDLAGLGRMVIGLLLYFGGQLALTEREAVLTR